MKTNREKIADAAKAFMDYRHLSEKDMLEMVTKVSGVPLELVKDCFYWYEVHGNYDKQQQSALRLKAYLAEDGGVS
jgi:hypothetical protein